ncbi:hypothetical protein GSI_03190 [Ganoderma sinense ZZ0214-1]|uniref:Uncharacterized protein n=1 Tax=Ganoderma sinense ZZ0214-1 TaxID=1077348 RepID=A0A2G8SKX2_9APHY|nr:hypothetical protein GSI_03190 [Ganoderma sinense ZZ0214-1]
MALRARCNPNHVLRDGHWLGPRDNCCVKFLPEGAGATAASVRTTVDDACHAQIEAKLATRQARSRARFRGKHNPDLVLCNNHSLEAGPGCCINFLPEGESSVAASARVAIDDALRGQIEATLAAPPEPRASAVCRICKGLTSKTVQQARCNIFSILLPQQADAIVWHLRSCHGKEFEIGDIVFVPRH